MRTRTRSVLLASVLAAATFAADRAVAGASPGAVAHPRPPSVICPALPPALAPAAATTSARPGSVVAVAVPRLTFVFIVDDRLVVTTNTERAPDPNDRFYVVTEGGALPATSRLRERVLNACG